MKPFIPQLVYFEPEALHYPLGKELYEKFKRMHIDIRETTSHNQVRGIPGDNELQQYRNAKSTLVVGVRRTLKFDTSKPSAEYAIPLATGCMGHCHYCYLQTTIMIYKSNIKRGEKMNILIDHMKQTIRKIDAFIDNYTIGTLIIEKGQAFLETEIGELIVLNDSFEIQVLAGSQYHTITYEQATNTFCSDAPEWHLFAGFECRVRKAVA